MKDFQWRNFIVFWFFFSPNVWCHSYREVVKWQLKNHDIGDDERKHTGGVGVGSEAEEHYVDLSTDNEEEAASSLEEEEPGPEDLLSKICHRHPLR